MAEFTEVMKQRERMCESFHDKYGDPKCNECLINRESLFGCSDYVTHYYKEAEKIIMDWAKAHPIKTNADKFEEVFGVKPVLKGYLS